MQIKNVTHPDGTAVAIHQVARQLAIIDAILICAIAKSSESNVATLLEHASSLIGPIVAEQLPAAAATVNTVERFWAQPLTILAEAFEPIVTGDIEQAFRDKLNACLKQAGIVMNAGDSERADTPLPTLSWYERQKSRLGWSIDEEAILLARFGVARPGDVEGEQTFLELIRTVQDPEVLIAIRSEMASTGEPSV